MSDHLLESFSLVSILTEQGVHHQERLSQNDWLKTTWKLIPSPSNPRLQAMWQSSSPGFLYPTAFYLGTPSQ